METREGNFFENVLQMLNDWQYREIKDGRVLLLKKETRKMARHDEAMVKAVEMAARGEEPKQAWDAALELAGWKGKSCARAAFLGPCSEGMMPGCRKGNDSQEKRTRSMSSNC